MNYLRLGVVRELFESGLGQFLELDFSGTYLRKGDLWV